MNLVLSSYIRVKVKRALYPYMPPTIVKLMDHPDFLDISHVTSYHAVILSAFFATFAMLCGSFLSKRYRILSYGALLVVAGINLQRLLSFIFAEHRLYVQARLDSGNFDIREYIFFRVDCLYSRDRSFKAYLLFTSTILLITVGGVLGYVSSDNSLGESLWSAWTFVADPGTHADSVEFPQRIVGVAVTIGGMVIFALVIGIVSEDVSTLMDGLRKGTCAVIAHHHTLILGYSDKLIPTIYQIGLANKSLGGAAIVVLSEVDKEELELRIKRSGIDLHGSEVIVRTGIPYLQADLRRVSAEDARSIIILSDRSENNADMADVNAVRNVLCLNAMGAPKNGHIVCEICDIDNEDLVRIVGKNTVETFVSHDIIGRLMIQCARERGLSLVLESLLGFEGDEFYIQEWPELTGLSFGELMFRMDGAVVVGIAKAKVGIEVTRRVLLNPDSDMILQPGDAVIVIAEDDDTYKPSSEPLYYPEADAEEIENIVCNWGKGGSPHKATRPERFLFIGWRRDVRDMIRELDKLVSPSSQLMIFCNLPEKERQVRLKEAGFNAAHLSNISISHLCGNSTCRKDLEALPLESYDSILILADEEYENVDGGQNREVYADSRTLSCLLLVRDIQNRRRKAERFRRKSIVATLNNIGFNGIKNPLSSPANKGGMTPPMLSRRPSSTKLHEIEAVRAGKIFKIEPHMQTLMMTEHEEDRLVAEENKKQYAVISEILDARTRPLVSIASTTDYVTSNELVSKLFRSKRL